ncbi:MAG TPA: methyltransferase domain-containing protein [Pricia antarctica]|uniref:Methyltransferase domain-containing protein n=1 Tax=Pricia antarctica TaxID=641691 RepID=A0A831VR82_9FLAO|nr:methyltransferase domain-containing protein [Pricia antarctica]
MRCYICDKSDWHLRKDLNEKSVVGICKNCGFIAHQKEESEEAKLNEFYRKEYRNAPTSNNIKTTNRKQNYIKTFLTEYLKDRHGLVIGDVGAATGYLVAWFRRMSDAKGVPYGHRATGCELTTTYRRYSEHILKIPLTETLEKKHKYDLICFYHVLEHMMASDKKLIEHIALLKDDGHLFISVPEWLRVIEDIAQEGELTVASYFHKNHICCFTRTSFHNLLKKAGLYIVKEDYEQYGQTYLLTRQKDGFPVEPIIKEKWEDVNAKIDSVVRAITHYKAKHYELATNEWRLFPEAWTRYIFDNHKKDPDRQEHDFKICNEFMGENLAFITSQAVWHYQFQRYKESYALFEKVCQLRPVEDFLIYMAWCKERMGEFDQAIHLMDIAVIINPQKWREVEDWKGNIGSKMPTWDERAKENLKEQLYQKGVQAGNKINLIDPHMDEPGKKEGVKADGKTKDTGSGAGSNK